MSRSGYENSPAVITGAFVQLIEDIIGIVPNIITFQYNPESISRSLEPWNPFEVDDTNRGAQAPTVQPYSPSEKFSFTLELHAADGMDLGNPLQVGTGVASTIAALQKLTQPTEGLLGDLVASAQALAGNDAASVERPSVPITLMILGPGVIYPVRVTSLSVDQKEFSPLLYPIHASVSLEMVVLTPDVFMCRETAASGAAVATYNFTKLQENALAILNIANSVQNTVGSVVPL
ncbi:MAG: hypothetical protein AAF412_14315 [Pseudomonadota bacterium]